MEALEHMRVFPRATTAKSWRWQMPARTSNNLVSDESGGRRVTSSMN